MPHISRSSLVMYSAEQMFDLVSDIESYPEFIPGCVRGTILNREGLKPEAVWVEASLELSKGGLRHTFTTRNRLVAGESIEMNLLEGPFKQLSGVWTFTALADAGSKVSLELDFEMSSPLTRLTVGAMVGQVLNRMVDAFAQRAKQVYG